MNKKEAAAELGVTPRTLERHMSGGRIAYAMRKGKTGEEAFFDAAEVARFGAELRGVTHSPTVVKSEAPTSSDQPRHPDAASPSQALERTGSGQGIEAFVSMVADALQANLAQGNGIPTVPLRDKMTLSFKEASRLSGVPESHLRAAYASGSLRGAKIGRGVRVTPDDVRKYVEGRMKAKKRG